MLFFNTSKIQFESKSQQHGHGVRTWRSCFSIRQRYNLKANHNLLWKGWRLFSVVFQYVKDTIWKQITTVMSRTASERMLFFNTSKIQFESKSQLFPFRNSKQFSCFSIRQRYNLKANHNYTVKHAIAFPVVFQYVKDTIWKQITTIRQNYTMPH